jgi:hypothetical protein
MGKVIDIGLEPMHVTAKLIISPASCLEDSIFSLYHIFLGRTVFSDKMGQRWTTFSRYIQGDSKSNAVETFIMSQDEA